MNVLSLFDGMSCGQIALNKLKVNYDNYYASEIDKFAIKITQKNFPNTIQIGDVQKIDIKSLPKIDLLIGGSPCQSFSNAGKKEGFNGKSGLFWDYVNILKNVKPRYFLLENVVMKKEWQDIISRELGVAPILINSRIFSAQNRPRLYWTNISNITIPEDKGIKIRHILDENVKPKYYLSDKAIAKIRRSKFKREFATIDTEKTKTLIASHYKIPGDGIYLKDNVGIRKYSPTECERLQTVPHNYTEGVSDTQRYRMLGNGWTVDVIAHILSFMQFDCDYK